MSNVEGMSTNPEPENDTTSSGSKQPERSRDDSGIFFSPPPILSKLVRCASTPLSDKSLQSLLTLDFDYPLTSDRDSTSTRRLSRASSDLLTTNLSSVEEHITSCPPTPTELTKCRSEPLITRVNLNHGAGSQDSQELSLSFKCPEVGSKLRAEDQIHKERNRLLSEDDFLRLHRTSDSGFGSDFSASILSSAETSQSSFSVATSATNTPSTSSVGPSSILVSKDRDIYDSKKQKKFERERGAVGGASRPLHRGVRFAHIPGILEGRDHIDFICLLSEMGMVHILSQIWKHLGVEDLGRSQQVCGTWRACLISDRNAGARWKEAKEIYMENPHPGRPPQARARLLKTSPRKALSSVSNILASPSKFEHKRSQNQLPPPVVISPSKYRHKLFAEEASRLGPEEQLQPCPRCTMPCRVNRPQSLAQCTRLSCQYSFCTHCMCASHGDTPCRPASRTTRSAKAASGVASKKSRSRLKRL